MNEINVPSEGTAQNHLTQAANAVDLALDAALCTRLRQVEQRVIAAQGIKAAAAKPLSVHVLAVSKGVEAATLRCAYACGQRAFGESYVQEALGKQDALADLPIDWHFIGPLQANKTRAVAERFSWVHSVDRLRIAERLSAQRPTNLAPLNICLQINIDREASKSGTMPEDLPTLARTVAQLPHLHLRGLMAIPQPSDNPEKQSDSFRRVRVLFDALRAEGLPLDTLSMGMSDDLESAIAQGATWLRVGSAIFGLRRASL
jgi:hypothetical protein